MNENESLETILEQVLELPDLQERAAYLAEACGDNEAMRAEVESLIAAHDAADAGFMDTLVDPVWSEIPGEKEGDSIGRYKLLQQIGEGGFGTVYMADQTEPVKRRVALKVIKAGMDSKEIIARFEAERQALALMDHPNIAKVHDAGTTGGGRPYFVMELVKGVPITQYCADQNLNTKARLALFNDVCAAVQHAHQKGIIHRDLKPSNIMVSPHDGKPVVKVIDFGIAKAISMELTEKTVFTQLGRMMGTPQYMSPEQAELNALDIDTRSDIYSLGVVLYELLTGTTPLDGEQLRSAAYGEMQRLIREETPVKPSTRVSTISQGGPVSPIADHRSLQGDLDWIVMKALEKDRSRRYETANALAQDLERHLRDEPVSAGPPSAGYRMSKFVRRNRRVLLSGAAAAVALLIGLSVAGGVWFQGRERVIRIEENADNLIEEAEQLMAENEAAVNYDDDSSFRRASELARRAEELLKGTGGSVSEVKKRSQRLKTEVQHEESARILITEIEDALMKEMSSLSDSKTGKSSNASGLARAFGEFGLDPLNGRVEDTVESIRARRAPLRDRIIVGLVAWEDSLTKDEPGKSARLADIIDRADSNPWRRELRQAIKANDSAALEALVDSPEMAEQPTMTVLQLSAALEEEQLAGATVKLLRRAQQEAPENFWTNYTLGITLAGAIDREEGHDVRQKGFNLGSANLGDDSVGMLPEVDPDRPEFDEAIGFLRAAVAARPDAGMARLFLGATLAAGGHLDEAIATHRTTASRIPESAFLDLLIGSALLRQKRREEAIPYLRRASEHDNGGLSMAHFQLGCSLATLGHYDEGGAELMKAVELLKKENEEHESEQIPGEDDGDFQILGMSGELDESMAHLWIAFIQYQRGEISEALASCRMALEANPEDAKAYGMWGFVLMQKSELKAAKGALERAFELGADSADIINYYGTTLMLLGNPAEGLIYIEKAVALKPEDSTIQTNLGACLMNLDRMAEAEGPFRKAVAISPRYPLALNNLGTWFVRQGDREKALELYREAHALDPSDPRSTRNIAVTLGNAGEVEEAIPYYQLLNDPEEYLKLAAGLMAAEMFEEAIDALERAVALKPSMADAHDQLGNAYCKADRWADAVEPFRTAVRLAPDSAISQEMLGMTLAVKGDHEEALSHFMKASELEPGIWLSTKYLPVALLAMGRISGALLAHVSSGELESPFKLLSEKEQGLKEALKQHGPDAPATQAILQDISGIVHSFILAADFLPAPSAQELRAFWDSHRDELAGTFQFAKVRIITRLKQSVDDPNRNNQVEKKLLENLRAQLLEGADFGALAKEHSENSHAEDGGLQEVKRGFDLFRALDHAAFSQEEGEISGVIENDGAYYLLKVDSFRPIEEGNFEDPEVQKATSSLFEDHRRRDWEKRYLALLQDSGPDLILGKIQNLAGERLLAAGKPAGAKELFEKAFSVMKAVLGEEDPITVKAKDNLDLCVARLAKGAEAGPPGEGDDEEGGLAGLKPEEAKSVEEARMAVDELKARVTKNDDKLVNALVQLGFAYQNVVKFDEAAGCMSEAGEVARKVHSGEHATVASCLHFLGYVRLRQGELKKAAKAFEASLEMRKKLKVRDSILAESMKQLGQVYSKLGQLGKAQELLERALGIQKETWGDKDERVGRTLSELGLNFQRQVNFDEAEKSFRRSIDIMTGLEKEARADLATPLSNLGVLLRVRGNAPAAEEELNKAIAILETLGPNGRLPGALAEVYSNLGLVFIDQGEKMKAQLQFEKALKLHKAELGPEHVGRLTLLNNLAMVLPTVEAEKIQKETLALAIKRFGPDHEIIATCFNNIARSLSSNGKSEDAEAKAQKGLEMARRLFPNVPHPNVVHALNGLAQIQTGRGNFKGALDHATEAEKMARAVYGKMHLITAVCLNTRATVLLTRGDFPGAKPLLREVLEIKRQCLEATNSRVFSSIANLGACLSVLGEHEEAKELLLKALPLQREHFGKDSLQVGINLKFLSVALMGLDDLPGSRLRSDEAIAILRGHPDEKSALADALFLRARLARKEGNPLKAEVWIRESLELIRALPQPAPAKVARALEFLVEILVEQKNYAKAQVEMKIALAELKKEGGKGEAPIAAGLASMAQNFLKVGRFAEMILLLQEIVAWQEENLEPNDQATLRSMNLLVLSYQQTKDFENGIPLSEEFHKRMVDLLGPNDVNTQMATMRLAQSYLMVGQPEKALPLIETVRANSKDQETIVNASAFLLSIEEKLGKADAELKARAAELFLESQKLAKNDKVTYGSILSGHVQICLQAEAFKAAERLARECAKVRSEALPADSWYQFSAKILIGRALYGQRKFADAEPLLVDGYQGLVKHLESIPPEGRQILSLTLEWLVEFYEARGEAGDAEKAADYRAKLENETKDAAGNKEQSPEKE